MGGGSKLPKFFQWENFKVEFDREISAQKLVYMCRTTARAGGPQEDELSTEYILYGAHVLLLIVKTLNPFNLRSDKCKSKILVAKPSTCIYITSETPSKISMNCPLIYVPFVFSMTAC